MAAYLLPFKVISVQALLLMFVIAIEAVVLRRRLRYSPRKSVEFAMTLNLLSLVVGWLVFFTGLALLRGGSAGQVERLLIRILFSTGRAPNAFTWVVLAGFGTFVVTVLIEIVGFVQLQIFREEREQVDERYKQRRPRFAMAYQRGKDDRGDNEPETKPLTTILIANAASYSLMLVVLFALQLIYPLENGPLRIIAPFQ
ncbi:MAG: filament integrity protein FraC [Cyanobacteria bacterium P01_A01_bin.135]